MQKEWNDVLAGLVRHRGKIAGTLVGLLLGWLTIRYGIGRALFVTLCLLGGYWIGSRFDEGARPNWRSLWDRFGGPEE